MSKEAKQIKLKWEPITVNDNERIWALGVIRGSYLTDIRAYVSREANGRWEYRIVGIIEQGMEPSLDEAIKTANKIIEGE